MTPLVYVSIYLYIYIYIYYFKNNISFLLIFIISFLIKNILISKIIHVRHHRHRRSLMLVRSDRVVRVAWGGSETYFCMNLMMAARLFSSRPVNAMTRPLRLINSWITDMVRSGDFVRTLIWIVVR